MNKKISEFSVLDQEYLKGLTVLYVEDDEMTRNLFTRYLSRFTGKLIIARDGVEGLASFRDHRPHIIVTDVMMPHLDGLSMLDEIRTLDGKVPIVVLTALDENDCLIKAINIGIDSFVSKPINKLDLHACLLKSAHRLLAEEMLLQVAASEERIKLARDLHDGLLQSLTAAALQLEMASRLIDTDSQEAQQHLCETQDIIIAEQRALRSHIQHLKPVLVRRPEMLHELSASLDELAARMGRHWSLPVEMEYDDNLDHGIPRILCREIYYLVHEALINVAHHARASSARAELRLDGNATVKISVRDNGRGFPFCGSYELQDLQTMSAGPFTLMERTAHLGGSLVIHSGAAGSHLEISLPLAE